MAALQSYGEPLKAGELEALLQVGLDACHKHPCGSCRWPDRTCLRVPPTCRITREAPAHCSETGMPVCILYTPVRCIYALVLAPE